MNHILDGIISDLIEAFPEFDINSITNLSHTDNIFSCDELDGGVCVIERATYRAALGPEPSLESIINGTAVFPAYDIRCYLKFVHLSYLTPPTQSGANKLIEDALSLAREKYGDFTPIGYLSEGCCLNQLENPEEQLQKIKNALDANGISTELDLDPSSDDVFEIDGNSVNIGRVNLKTSPIYYPGQNED